MLITAALTFQVSPTFGDDLAGCLFLSGTFDFAVVVVVVVVVVIVVLLVIPFTSGKVMHGSASMAII